MSLHDARYLPIHLLVLQVGCGLIVMALGFAIAPQLLSIDVASSGALAMGVWAMVMIVACPMVTTALLTNRLRPALNALATGTPEEQAGVSPRELRALYSLPAKLSSYDLGSAAVAALVTMVPPLRPSQTDAATQMSSVLFALTLASVGTLPLYILMRVFVSRVLEGAPPPAARKAIEHLDPNRRTRLRRRLLLAVAAPVAFVSLGSSLLVSGHARASYADAWQRDVEETVRGTLDTVGGDRAGVAQAIHELEAHGINVEVSSDPAPVHVLHDVRGMTEMTIPLHQGHARVRFFAAPTSAITGVYGLLAAVATLLAGLLGGRIGEAFGQDIELARREIAQTGVADVLKGTKVQRSARFAAISTLLSAIDELKSIFREFASAQELAIDAHAATERMRGMFLASMSHDLKGPLNGILGFAELVQRGDLNEGQRESCSIIEQRGRELLALIDTILDSARAEAGQLYISPEWTMVGDVVMSAVLDARDMSVGTNVQVAAQIQPGVPKLFVDGSRIVQALTAVILTAVRFSAENSIVQVSATLPASAARLRVSVETAGGGIPRAEIEKMFEAFKYADKARRLGSLGLSLSLARSMLELHNGSIEIDTTQSGGTIFNAWLPLSGERLSAQGLGSIRPPS